MAQRQPDPNDPTPRSVDLPLPPELPIGEVEAYVAAVTAAVKDGGDANEIAGGYSAIAQARRLLVVLMTGDVTVALGLAEVLTTTLRALVKAEQEPHG